MSDKDEIADLEGLIRGYHNIITTTRTNLANEEFFNRQLEHYQRVIDHHEKLKRELIESRDNGPATIDHAKKQIRVLKQRVLRLKRKRDIERLIKLQAQLNGLQNEQ